MTDNITQEDTPPSVGEILKQARLEKGLTLEQVSKNIRINKSQLSLLEEETEPLVCDVYKLGFVRLYAQYLELDTEDIVEKFKIQSHSQKTSPMLTFPAPLPGRGLPSKHIIGGCFLALIFIVIGWKWMKREAPAPEAYGHLMQVKEEITDEPPVLSQEAAEAPTPMTKTVNLRTNETTWIEVKDLEGNVIFSKIFQPGEAHEFQNPESLLLTTGNLKGIQLSSSDKTFVQNGQSGEVRRDIPLDPDKWVE
jgi:cytoskeletal protein RodZ